MIGLHNIVWLELGQLQLADYAYLQVLHGPLGMLRSRLTGERDIVYVASGTEDNTLSKESDIHHPEGHTMLQPIGQGSTSNMKTSLATPNYLLCR